VRAVEGGRVTVRGTGLPVDHSTVLLGATPARLAFTSKTRLVILIPGDLEGGTTPVHVPGMHGETVYLSIAAPCATGLHQVDNPVFDREGNLYVTYSGTRGQEVPVSIFRVRPNGTRETFSSGIVNATSMAFDPEGRLYVSSRFEGTVYRVEEDGGFESFATDLGVACGLAFAEDGTLFVGDRSGTLFRVDRHGKAAPFASIPPSVAAFHLAMAPDGALYVTAPTLSAYDSVYRVAPDGTVSTVADSFGRPQGIAFEASGAALVVEALAGISGLYRLRPRQPPELILTGPGLVGVAVVPSGGLVVCSNETAFRCPQA